MRTDTELRRRELTRRKALWSLAGMHPGDSKAIAVLDVLDEVEKSEGLERGSSAQTPSADEVQRLVPLEPHPIGCDIVRESNIPQPWRERFLQASVGATRVEEGPYAYDWNRFLTEWKSGMEFLEKHRIASVKHG